MFDGDCGFCRFWVARWQSLVGDRVAFAPYQEVASTFPEIPLAQFRESVVFIDENGGRSFGAHAVFGVLALAPHRRWPLSCYEHIPGAGWCFESTYRFVARHRRLSGAMTHCLWGRQPQAPDCLLVRWIFLRALALVYLCAFLSLWVQIHGLIGSDGILPATDYLGLAASYLGPARYWQVPTLGWLSSSDLALHIFCGAGCVFSLAALLGWLEGPAFLSLWALYLSLVQIGQEFLGFQWDNLLLETGLLACFFAAWSWRSHPSSIVPSRRITLWLLRILLFKLMFMSGLAKLASGDVTWRNLTALLYHYQTQPLPTWIGWYAALLPGWFQKLSVLIMFAIELVIPFLIFAPRRPRLLAFWAILFLQTTILLTGNYGFFNWLAIVLCLTLLDDLTVPRILPPKVVTPSVLDLSPSASARIKLAMVVVYGAVFVSLSGARVVEGFGSSGRSSSVFDGLERWLSPIRSFNRYGLFSVMTTQRPEIIIEGSDDGQHWIPYEFKYKPGDTKRRPGFVAPYHPRLDWQMWFAALGGPRQERWFGAFLRSLLVGSPEVTGLFARIPFADHPPHFIRALLYEYRFADPAIHHSQGDWWQRNFVREYAPTTSLQVPPPGP